MPRAIHGIILRDIVNSIMVHLLLLQRLLLVVFLVIELRELESSEHHIYASESDACSGIF
jgi:hypothetical protein